MDKRDLVTILEDAHPELRDALHLPRFAVVTAIPDPPAAGETCRHPAPKYAVNCRLLTHDLVPDPAMPELRDVPVSLPGAGAARGMAALPQPGTVVEIAFAYGQLHLPFIRSALPYELPLPAIDAAAQRWQHTPATFQHVTAAGWQRTTDGAIEDTAATTIRHTAGVSAQMVAPHVWFGTQTHNTLQLLVDHLATIRDALAVIAAHTHPDTTASASQPTIQAASDATETIRALIASFTL